MKKLDYEAEMIVSVMKRWKNNLGKELLLNLQKKLPGALINFLKWERENMNADSIQFSNLIKGGKKGKTIKPI